LDIAVVVAALLSVAVVIVVVIVVVVVALGERMKLRFNLSRTSFNLVPLASVLGESKPVVGTRLSVLLLWSVHVTCSTTTASSAIVERHWGTETTRGATEVTGVAVRDVGVDVGAAAAADAAAAVAVAVEVPWIDYIYYATMKECTRKTVLSTV